jgi:hypothetical protein
MDNIKATIKKILKEATSAAVSGNYKVPIVLAPQSWEKDQLEPFIEPVYQYTNAELAYEEADGDFNETPAKRKSIETKTRKMSKIVKNLKKKYQGQNDEEGSAINPTMNGLPLKEELLKEDLAVWFGTKKKPKGSKQPKGPWVNICSRDKNGKHPPMRILNHIQNVVLLVLRVKCQMLKRKRLVLKKEGRKNKIQNLEREMRQRWLVINQRNELF